ncbi:unnamed protein product [Rotaria sp. Silwood2]|nr:unnamed protein product [Rotaria sp. Silwood2]
MTFNKCSVRGKLYGYMMDEAGNEVQDIEKLNAIDFQGKDSDFEWYDKKLLDAIEQNDNDVHNFFTLLSLCHTVMSEERNGEIIYQAQSPDDHALVSASRTFGFTFIKLATDGLRILCLAYKELSESDYNRWTQKLHAAKTSMEKRDEKVKDAYEEIEKNLILIGATGIEDKLQDGVPQCIERLACAGIKIWVLTGDKLETARNIGLSCRLLTNDMELYVIEEENENAVERKLQEVRNEMINKIEQLFYVCIEDKNKRLDWKDWGIDVMKFHQYRKPYYQSHSEAQRLNGHAMTTIDTNQQDDEEFEGFGLLITGQALTFALSEKFKMKFLEIGTMCKAVVCCRATPLQKAQVVDLVMKNERKITLAIGDGANDVSMIQKAHIGVGISGQEGRQAVLASDYSLGQFRFLERLLLVHGRWSYLRISKFLRYFFYKNIAFTLCHFWLGFFSGFSAQTLYDPFFIATYNVFFTSLPVLVLGVFDQDISADHSLSKPHLYTPGQNDEFFNKKVFAESVIHGILTSCIIFFVPYLSISNATRSDGMTLADLQSFGFTVATIMVIIVNLENALEIWYWTSLYHFALWATIVTHFLFHFALYSTIIGKIFKNNYKYIGVTQAVLSTSNFWFTLLLTCVILLLPVFGREFFRMRFMPTKIDRARLNQKFRMEEKAAFVAHMQYKLRQRKRPIYSGYAYSQEEGWGRLITSGLMQSKSSSSPRPSSQTTNVSTSEILVYMSLFFHL